MDPQNVLEKVRKLLRLAERGGTPEEAANAAAKAQAILERYHLDQAALDLEPDEDIGVGEPLSCAGRLCTWRARLASAVADVNGCRTYYQRSRERVGKWYQGFVRIMIVGRPSDVSAARYLYLCLEQEIDRMARSASPPPRALGGRRAWSNAYRLGVVDTVRRRLREAKAHEASEARTRWAGEAGALVRLREHEQKGEQVDAWLAKRFDFSETRPAAGPSSADGWAAGREAGQRVDLGSSGAGQVGAAPKQLAGAGD